MRILIVSNASWCPSGYGVQLRNIVPRLKGGGHEVAVSAFFGLQGGSIEHDGVKQYPAGFAPYGNDVIAMHATDFRADVVIALIDIWVYRPELFKQVRLVPWSPIDHSPVPGPVFERFRASWHSMTYSKWGVAELNKLGHTDVEYCPLGVETEIFRPERHNREIYRQLFGIPKDAFVVGMVAANQTGFPTRKGFERIMPAVANLRKKHSDIMLYIHSFIGTEMGGVPLTKMAEVFGIGTSCYFTNPDVFRRGGLSREDLARLYNCFDVLAMPSSAEGFGLPAIEAQACGVPVIATNFSACTELCASGWLVEPVTMIMTPLLSFQAVPSVKEIEDRIEFAYLNPSELEEQQKRAHEFAQQYSWDVVCNDYMLPIMRKWEEELSAPVVQNLRERPEHAKVEVRGFKPFPDTEG